MSDTKEDEPEGLVMSEREFRADPGKAVRAAKCAPHVVVQSADGRARMVIVRQREALVLE